MIVFQKINQLRIPDKTSFVLIALCNTFVTIKNLNSIGQQSNLRSTKRENCSNLGFFLVRIFPYSDWIRGFTEIYKCPYSVRMLEKADQKKLRIRTHFTQWKANWIRSFMCDFLENLGATFRRVITCIES